MKILYGATIAKTTRLTVTLSNYKENVISPTNANVTGTLNMSGNSTVLGGLNATIDISQNWASSGGHWQITKENWNYKTFSTQFVLSSTTFPQWGLMRQGKSPNLVSEKSIEWNTGPFAAAGVYAFLASVAVFGVMRLRSRPK
jgi:hypothetical protein